MTTIQYFLKGERVGIRRDLQDHSEHLHRVLLAVKHSFGLFDAYVLDFNRAGAYVVPSNEEYDYQYKLRGIIENWRVMDRTELDAYAKFEHEKCLESIAYFYNNYAVLKDAAGNDFEKHPMTDEEINLIMDYRTMKKRRK